MGISIKKIKLINFKRFREYTICPNEHMNILVGDNETGKSSVLEAIDLVATGSIKRVESIGLDRLLNVEAVSEFKNGEHSFEKLPKLIIELYLEGQFDYTMNGKNNTENIECDGIRLLCEPNLDYRNEIATILAETPDYFPYDYYSIRFSTFMDAGYTSYKKKLHCIFIDSSNMNSAFATADFIKRMYMQHTEENVKERALHKTKYRQMRDGFRANCLRELNSRLEASKQYEFGLKGGPGVDMESDLMIYEKGVGIDSKGTGRQIFIKTDFALERSKKNVDVILIEEPENHLSPVNLRKLVQEIGNSQTGQIFISTHNSFIGTRLELSNLLIMQPTSLNKPLMLKELSEETAKYFMKAPPAGIIEFALAEKIILVEGPSEYMLLEEFYIAQLARKPEVDGVHIIDVRGLSFKRYLDIAKLTKCKVAVITDNDANFEKNCKEKYSEYNLSHNIKVFYDSDNKKRTFEIVLYKDNVRLCTDLFGDNAQDYMLRNKTEAAYRLLCQEQPINVPDYIRRAIEWIKE